MKNLLRLQPDLPRPGNDNRREYSDMGWREGFKWVGGFWLLTAITLYVAFRLMTAFPETAYHIGGFINRITEWFL